MANTTKKTAGSKKRKTKKAVATQMVQFRATKKLLTAIKKDMKAKGLASRAQYLREVVEQSVQ